MGIYLQGQAEIAREDFVVKKCLQGWISRKIEQRCVAKMIQKDVLQKMDFRINIIVILDVEEVLLGRNKKR